MAALRGLTVAGWACVLGAVVAAGPAGCVSVYVPEPGSQSFEFAGAAWPGVPAEAWPARSPMWSGLRRATLAGGGGLRPRGTVIVSPGAFVPMDGSPRHADRAAREMREDAGALMARRDGRADPRGSGISVTSEGGGALVFVAADAREAEQIAAGGAGMPAFTVRFLSGRDRPADTPATSAAPTGGQPRRISVQMERTWMAFYDPLRGDGSAGPTPDSRGTVVILPGMFGTPEGTVGQLVGLLRRQGWSVLRLLAHPSRFTERWRLEVDPGSEEGLARAAALAADELADRASECAYAVHAGLLALRERRPALNDRPRVLLGMSGGAMAVPAVMAYRPGDFAAAVLIAGGVGYLRIALDSSYTGWIDALRFTGPGGRALTDAEKDAFVAAYEQRAPLDSARLAPVLRGRPVLILHAEGDSAVPAPTGQRLWDLAGRPERWSFATGHELLFFMLPSAMPRLLRWLDEHTPAPPEPVGGIDRRATPPQDAAAC